ncbi:HEAT repeat domain-containing protein [Streptomyces paludis]|uniref:HEAT repeat domain-containing protein n=1 Tax=Streptomyces paludis TaxID=2282738 RepID=A0A345HYW5_9ACTN|nr:HEAT repeat domain-containing protein [Streptomyces paludis]AXG81889.1 HEAT repeat domain-containing protein [Streptomyces paludis]
MRATFLDESLDDQWYEARWIVSAAATFHYVEDAVASECYVSVSGDVPTVVEGTLRMVMEDLDVWSPDELVAAVDDANDPVGRGSALIRLVIGSPIHYDAEIAERVYDGLDDPDHRVREMAIWASSYRAFPQYRSRLRELAERDPEGSVRDSAREMLEFYDQAGVAES